VTAEIEEFATTPAPAAPAAPAGAVPAASAFSRSVVVSGVRCLLAYIVFPWLLPLFGLAAGVGAAVGLAVGVVAIGFNVASIRRFRRSTVSWRWLVIGINVAVIGLLVVLLALDLGQLVG
jgi:hypothetical protein